MMHIQNVSKDMYFNENGPTFSSFFFFLSYKIHAEQVQIQECKQRKKKKKLRELN